MYEYFFKPNGHWNRITEEQYGVLCSFYDLNMIKRVWKEIE